jgi:hypothetical protein
MDIQVPENLADVENIDELRDELIAAFDKALADDDVSNENLAELADAIEAVTAERDARQARDEQAKAEREQLAARVDAARATVDTDDDEDDDGEPVEPEADAQPEAQPDADSGDEQPVEPEVREPVAAATQPAPTAAAVSRRAPKPASPASKPAVTIRAAADVPGVGNGQRIDVAQIAQLLSDRAQGIGLSHGNPTKYAVASVDTNVPENLRWSRSSGMTLGEMCDLAVRESLAGQDAKSLIASGGFKAPTQPVYDLFQVEATDGLLDLPTIGMPRGSFDVPEFIGLDVVTAGQWTWTNALDATGPLAISELDVASNVATVVTASAHNLSVGSTVELSGTGEANLDGRYTVASVTDATTYTVATVGVGDTADIDAGTSKAVKGYVELPDPTMNTFTLEAEGLWIRAGNLTTRAWPELADRTQFLGMTGHAHTMSTSQINKIAAGATAVTVTSRPSDIAGDILSAIDLQVADMRSQYLLSDSQVLEVVCPHWWPNALRANMAMRNGVPIGEMPMAAVRDWFTMRNCRPQFVHGYDAQYGGSAATAWKTSSKMLIWIAGAYVAGDGGDITFGVTRDSALNETNDHTLIFTEQLHEVIRRGPAAREVTVTTAVNGQTGGLEFAGA